MFNYGNTQHPQCISPDAQLEIINPAKPSQNDKVNAIVDSGAMITCLPESTVNNIGELEYDIVEARTANGKIVSLKKYIVHITISNDDNSNSCQHEVQDIAVLAIPNKGYALIGRDIINDYKVVLDAPKGQWGLRCMEYCENQE